MLEKMDSILTQVNAAPTTAGQSGCGDRARRLTADEMQRIMRDAERLQERWGSNYDFDKHIGPPPILSEILRREILPKLNAHPEERERLLAAADRQESRRDEARRAAQLKAFQTTIGQRFADVTLDSYQVTTAEQRKAVDVLLTYQSGIKKYVASGVGIVAYGAAGTGKTHLLAATGKVAIGADLAVEWVNGQDLFASFRDAIAEHDSENEIVRAMVTPSVLVIDDVLPPSGLLTEYQAAQLYRIIDRRYRDGKPTWASMNVASGEEAARGIGAQTVDRLRDGALTLFFSGPSFREARK